MSEIKMPDQSSVSLPKIDCEAFLKALATALGEEGGIDRVVIDAACNPLEDSTQRLIKLSKTLDEQFKSVADQFGVSVSCLMRSAMMDCMVSGRAGQIAGEIKKRGVRAARK